MAVGSATTIPELSQIQAELLASRAQEPLAIQFPLIPICTKAKTFAGGAKTAAEHIRIRSAAALPDTESTVVICAAAGLPDEAHDMFGTLRKM